MKKTLQFSQATACSTANLGELGYRIKLKRLLKIVISWHVDTVCTCLEACFLEYNRARGGGGGRGCLRTPTFFGNYKESLRESVFRSPFSK